MSVVNTCPYGLRYLAVISECCKMLWLHRVQSNDYLLIIILDFFLYIYIAQCAHLHDWPQSLSTRLDLQGCAVFVAPPPPVHLRLQIIGWGRRSWAGPGSSWWPAQLANRPVEFSSVTWPESRDPPWGKPIVLLPSPPHAVGKHSNSWPRTVPETSATSATSEKPPLLPSPSLQLQNLKIIEVPD